ncbi:MAG TPA: nucleotidyltransferase domain-containing protein [Candidatus Aenigmarchaeota archaeon]|nr:nucleotidyltransferase domain-containing protein [Candidatus Aenigmarchaeota archaeon]
MKGYAKKYGDALLSVVVLDGEEKPILNDLKFKGLKGGLPLSFVYEQFHLKNEKFTSKLLRAKVLYDAGFMDMLRKSMKLVEEVRRRFDRYVLCVVLFGSWSRGEATKSSDYDLAVVMDDTDLKEMTRVEAKQKLFGIINSVALEISEKFVIQTYLLTEFWEHVRNANPVIFTLLRDGVPLYDKGLFTPWRLLLKMGKIAPTPEAIESFINSARLLEKQIDSQLEQLVTEQIYYTMLNPSQAVLMLMGVSPAHYGETPALMRRYLVRKGLLPAKCVKWLEEIIKLRKEVEHKGRKVSGKDLDKYWRRAREYLKVVDKLYEKLRREKIRKELKELDQLFRKSVKEVLREMGYKTSGLSPYQAFKRYLIKGEKIPSNYGNFVDYLMSLKKALKEGRVVTSDEVKKAKSTATDLFNVMTHLVEMRKIKPGKGLRFLYDDKEGELWIIGRTVFIIKDVKHPEKEVLRAKLEKDGSLSEASKSTILELDKVRKRWKGTTYVREKTLRDLERLLGKEIRIEL